MVREWERAADPARAAGIRVVHPRVGPVLHPGGGMLAKLVPIFSLGGGGRIGSGTQWISWVALTDALAALEFAIGEPALAGAVNVTAPNPETNATFTAALATALHRPSLMTVPDFAVRLLYGEMGEETVLSGQRVLPRRLLDAGFRFSFPTLPKPSRTNWPERT